MDLRGEVAVVTGASSGLGRRFALDMAAAGATVVAVARRRDLLEELEPLLRAASATSQAKVGDVTGHSGVRAVLGEVEEAHGPIGVLVNAAGIGEPRQGQATVPELTSVREVMETNYFGAVHSTLSVLPGMLERRRGVVVNVSSDNGRAPGPGEVAYGASKAALSAFTESMAMRVHGSGVRLHVLYPGWVPTDMGLGAVEDGMPMPPRMVRRTEEQVSKLLLARMGGSAIDIDAARLARLAPVARALVPRLYRNGLLRASSSRR
ncbi:MAG TPA: SDR family NAD(P)-dependent oxidoreductase [Acidimicrobiales bacterium]|nr:SDR family NAD(P)-dependent oxidoreductase [Acidimicrobiales bacterium]